MRTSDLVKLLAGDASPVRAAPMTPRLLVAALAGALVSAGLLVVWLGLRPMGVAMASPSFWMKAGYAALLALAGLLTAAQLGRPGGRVGLALWLALAAVAWLGMLAMKETMRTPAGGMAHLWLGWSWSACPFRILALAAPVLAALFLAMTRMTAPTRPALAGAAAGLFAGAVGASVYGLYCQETAAAFVVAWYTLGIAACAALGAAIGARLLRW